MTLDPTLLQTATDALVVSAYNSIRAHHGWEAAGPLAVTPDYAGLEMEPVIVSQGMVVDAFMPPRIATADNFPATMVPGWNANSTPPGTFEKMLNTDAVTTETAAFNAAAQAAYVFNHAPTTYVEVPITGPQVSARGFGFRKFYGDRLVDGDTDGPYALDLNGVAEGSYVQFKMSEPVFVTKIALWMSGAGSGAEFQFQGSNDNATYTDLLNPASLFAPTLAGLNEKLVVNTTAYQYYRLVLADGGGVHTVTVYEFAMYSIPQVLIESDEVPTVSSELVSARFLNMQDVVTPLEATYTFPVALDWAVYNMAYVWVKAAAAGTFGTITIESTDASTVVQNLTVSAADTWTRIKINLNSLVLVSGVNDVVGFTITTMETQGFDFTLGAMTIGETLELVTRNFEAEQYFNIAADSASAYLFFTTTDTHPTLLDGFEVKAVPTLAPPGGVEFDGTFQHVFHAGVLADADAALAAVNVYAAKFSLAAHELDRAYYFMFSVPTSIADLKVVGWAISREV